MLHRPLRSLQRANAASGSVLGWHMPPKRATPGTRSPVAKTPGPDNDPAFVQSKLAPEPEPEPEPEVEPEIDPELWCHAVKTALAFKGLKQGVRAARAERAAQSTALEPRTAYKSPPSSATQPEAGGAERAAAQPSPSSTAEHLEKLTVGAADWAPAWAAKYIKLAAPVIGVLAKATATAWPFLIVANNWVAWVWLTTDPDLLRAAFGLWLCFFGGTFPVLIAAYEALQLSHGESTYSSICAITTEVKVIISESAKDDARDDDGDGRADVDQLDARSLLLRKSQLVLTKCNPEKINTAIGELGATFLGAQTTRSCISVSLKMETDHLPRQAQDEQKATSKGAYVFAGVIATLKVQFAQTIAMSLSIAELLQTYVIDGRLQPLIEKITPDEYQKWVPVLLRWLCKYIAYRIAWYLQSLLSAFTTGAENGSVSLCSAFSVSSSRKYLGK